MNPPEQAPALQQIYEARLELVRQNEAEVEDLQHRLAQATRRGKELVTQMKIAKANFEEAASKIVDLLDEKEAGDEDEKYHPGTGNESKYGQDPRRKTCKKREKSTPDERSQSNNEDVKLERSISTISPRLQEIVELLESDDDNEIESNANEVKRKADHSAKRSRSSSSGESNHERISSISSKRSKSSSPSDKSGNKSNRSDETESSTARRARSSSTGSAEKSAKVTKKRSSSLTTLTNRIKLRPQPSGIPPERWLKSSVGRTRQELNNIDDMVQYMGSCEFGKSVVLSKFGKVYAIILNDEWNTLVQRNDEYQLWYIGLGPGRKRDARLVGASESSIPIFHAPREQYGTKELFYVGHYKVKKLEELETPVIEMEKERDMKITFAFEKFDERLDSIIKRGPDR